MDEGSEKILNDYVSIPSNDSKPEIYDSRNESFYNNLTYYEQNFSYSNFSSIDFCPNFSHVFINVTCEFPISYAEPMYG